MSGKVARIHRRKSWNSNRNPCFWPLYIKFLQNISCTSKLYFNHLQPILLLLMEEILHHLECIKPCKYWDKLPMNWCRISSINSMFGMLRFWSILIPGSQAVLSASLACCPGRSRQPSEHTNMYSPKSLTMPRIHQTKTNKICRYIYTIVL